MRFLYGISMTRGAAKKKRWGGGSLALKAPLAMPLHHGDCAKEQTHFGRPKVMSLNNCLSPCFMSCTKYAVLRNSLEEIWWWEYLSMVQFEVVYYKLTFLE